MGAKKTTLSKTDISIDRNVLLRAWTLMTQARAMSHLYEDKKEITGKYVHATSMGHEAVQLALSLQLQPQDYISPYYRDDSILLGTGITPYDLMLQLLAKKDDPFSGGRLYYAHPSLNDADKPKIPYQSSATGMQAIPSTGLAMGVQYREKENIGYTPKEDKSVVVCSIGDAAMTEGEISEALHMAALKQLPILYFVQDNEWDISAHSSEIRLQNSAEYAKGFKGIEIVEVDGADFMESYTELQKIISTIRKERRPFLIRASVPLLAHHTSGVRREWYRDDLEEAQSKDPYPRFKQQLLDAGFETEELEKIEQNSIELVHSDFQKAQAAEDPSPEDLFKFDYAPSPITEEKGERAPKGKEKTVMVDSALFAVREIMEKHPEALLYGQDVGGRLGGVFREAATLAQTFGSHRVFNTPIQEAFIIGSTAGMSIAGCKPIVEVQFADYIWPALNQLFTELSRSYYLSNGKWPISSVIRVPTGAYGSGGPFHSSSLESIVTNIKGIKVVYPSNGADMKGLMKAAFYDPNPVVVFEHKGLYWSKVKGTERAMTIEPDEDYVIPIGKGRICLEASEQNINEGNSIVVITYGMGVHWAMNAAKKLKDKIEVVDLRSLAPIDKDLVLERVKKHSKCLIITEEPDGHSFARAMSGWIQDLCFEYLDAPVKVLAAADVPAIPLNSILEEAMLPNADKAFDAMNSLLNY
jgi:2-oxoisovalerate dehydrogenase E1 component